MALDVDITSFVLSIIGLGATFVITLIAVVSRINEKLSKIEDNTNGISDIRNDLTKLTERVDMALRLGIQFGKGTVELTLKNLGAVSVSAQTSTSVQSTRYILQFEKPFKFDVMGTVACATGLDAKEHEMFGKNVISLAISPVQIMITVPSIDPKLCSEYMSFFLKWLDSEYFTRAEGTIAEYENIKV